MSLDRTRGYRGIVGLGNPGSEYVTSRHNAGFQLLDQFHCKFKGSNWRRATKGWLSGVQLKGKCVMLLKPGTFMNRSGEAVVKFMAEYGILPEELIVVHDDIDLQTQQVRVKQGGGHGGHNGVRSVMESIGSPDFCRIRIGIGRPAGKNNTVDFVLGSPDTEEDTAMFEKSLDLALQAVETVIFESQKKAMDQFNKKQQTLMSE